MLNGGYPRQKVLEYVHGNHELNASFNLKNIDKVLITIHALMRHKHIVPRSFNRIDTTL